MKVRREFPRRLIAERRVRPNVVVVDAPKVGGGSNLGYRTEEMRVNELIAYAAVERFDLGVLRWLSRPDDMPLKIAIRAPAQHSMTAEL